MDISWQIPRRGLLFLLATVLLVLAPQSLRMPLWITLVGLLCIGWRLAIHQGWLDYPGRWLRVSVVVFTLLVSISQINRIGIGLDWAAALLALSFVFKLIEMQSKRDVYVVITLSFAMLLVSFLYSQSLVVTLYVAICVLSILTTMVAINRSSPQDNPRGSFGLALRLTAQSLPLMLILFLLFPRIAPLWAVPVPTSADQTGVADEMTPGDISQLGRSAELAFRVGFAAGQSPPHRELYWRGLVLEDFDGTTWRRRGNSRFSLAAARGNPAADYAGRMELRGEPVDYSVILEPTQQPWLYGLHLVDPQAPSQFRARNFELFNNGPVAQRMTYNLRSYPEARTDVFLLESIRARALALPREGNDASREFALQLRSEQASDRDYANAVLNYFRRQPFFYTLTPPALNGSHIDDFLFNTRQGFCEHYASSFTFLMRAAGIPARVVVGYQGAEYNRFENYLMVYQYNAHAWSEIWLEGEGWVRVDPTGAVSPDRIDLGVEAALQDDPAFLDDARFSMMRFRGMNLINTLRLRLDAIEYEWNRRVVSYDDEVRFRLLERLLGDVSERRILLLMGTMAAMVVFFIALTVIRFRPQQTLRPVEKLYDTLCRDLARAGLPRRTGEGPRDYCRRVSAERPELAGELEQLTEMYVRLNYAASKDDDWQRRYQQNFKKRLNLFRLRKVALLRS